MATEYVLIVGVSVRILIHKRGIQRPANDRCFRDELPSQYLYPAMSQ